MGSKLYSVMVMLLLILLVTGCGKGSGAAGGLGAPGAVNAAANLLSAPLVSSVALGKTAQGQVQAMGINYYIALQGVFPTTGSTNNTGGYAYLGQIMLFAVNFVPQGWALCDGSLLSISSNTALFSLIGTTFGGNGTTNFALPDLRAHVPMGVGTLANPSEPSQVSGLAELSLVTGLSIGGTATGELAALGINYYMATAGVFPSSGGGPNSTGAPYIGQLMLFAGNFAPGGWVLCDGSLLSISSYNILFNLIGTTYGGNGTTNFALPDLRAHAAVGAGSLQNPPAVAQSSEEVALVSSIAAGGNATGQVDVLGINYGIVIQGTFPSQGSGAASVNNIGEVLMFAGNFAPGGWATCDGSILTISQYAAMFSLLSTNFGGNGTTNFAIPDLRGRVVAGVGN